MVIRKSGKWLSCFVIQRGRYANLHNFQMLEDWWSEILTLMLIWSTSDFQLETIYFLSVAAQHTQGNFLKFSRNLIDLELGAKSYADFSLSCYHVLLVAPIILMFYRLIYFLNVASTFACCLSMTISFLKCWVAFFCHSIIQNYLLVCFPNLQFMQIFCFLNDYIINVE